MWMLRILSFALLIIFHIENVRSDPPAELALQTTLLKNYNSKIRPVKKEDTVTQVAVYLNIAHVEKVDENEQTAVVHGNLWASWTDEYMIWDRKKYNLTKLSIQSSKLWQPALALYNSARGNTWHLYMNGLPATVYFTGKVWSSGTFSFAVTCQFDFTNWPFDQQNCPIVIADWIYGLAQVNLSDPNNAAEYAKPTIRLSYDPIDKKSKRNVGAWIVKDAWKKHCYWGPKGCKEDAPEGEPDWYWSLLEFGIILQRHLPYFSISVLWPFGIITTFILMCYWIEPYSANIGIIIFNLLLQGFFGMSLIEQMPPGSGSTPKIVRLYAMNLIITGLQLLLITACQFFEDYLPKKYELKIGFDITEIPKKMGVERFFQPKGLSFDPQEYLNPSEHPPESLESILENGSSSTSIGIGNALDDHDPRFEALQNPPTSSESEATQNSDSEFLISLPSNSDDAAPEVASSQKSIETAEPQTPLQIQLHHIKRFAFCLTVFIYIIAFLLVLYI